MYMENIIKLVKYFLAVPVSGNPSAVSCCLHRTPVAITHNSHSAFIVYTDNDVALIYTVLGTPCTTDATPRLVLKSNLGTQPLTLNE